ncbi:MAG TPA: hypothetical protein VHH11_12690 [Gammaproteobacteria bacterium]|nr:hypothetical protein [Gammaproteobacteria bacterium]
MSKDGWNVLDRLRRQRRRLAAALVPALLASVLAGAACPAMGAAPPPATHAAQHDHSAHAEHAQHPSPPSPAPSPIGDCPHCLGGDAAGNVSGAECAVAAAPAMATHATPVTLPALPVVHHVPAAASAVPPLIRAAVRDAAAPPAAVPLRLRHCTLLI